MVCVTDQEKDEAFADSLQNQYLPNLNIDEFFKQHENIKKGV